MAGVGRLFVAIRPPDEAVHAIAARLDAAFAAMPIPGTRVPPEQWHVTLRFVGEVGEVGRDRLMAELDGSALGNPFRVRLDGLGAFPNPARANVLWVGVDEDPALAALVDRVEAACVAAGNEPEGRPFVGHLTIGRMRPAVDAWPWLEAEADLRVAWDVDQIVLYAGHTRAEGLRYERIETFDLG